MLRAVKYSDPLGIINLNKVDYLSISMESRALGCIRKGPICLSKWLEGGGCFFSASYC